MKTGSYTPQKPVYKLPLFGEEHSLEGTFDLIERVERQFQENIISITLRCIKMPVSELAVLIAAIVPGMDSREIGERLLNEVGITTPDYTIIALHVHSFLRICIAKPSEREAAVKKAGEYLREAQASHGNTTDNSALAS